MAPVSTLRKSIPPESIRYYVSDTARQIVRFGLTNKVVGLACTPYPVRAEVTKTLALTVAAYSFTATMGTARTSFPPLLSTSNAGGLGTSGK